MQGISVCWFCADMPEWVTSLSMSPGGGEEWVTDANKMLSPISGASLNTCLVLATFLVEGSAEEGSGNTVEWSDVKWWQWNVNLHESDRERQIAYEPQGFPGGSDGKESTCNGGDPGSILESRRLPGEGNGYPLQYSCLENSMERGAWRAIIHGVAKS